MVDYTSEIKSILKDSSDLTVEQINAVANDTNIVSLGIDSLSLVEAIIGIEKKFNIDIELAGPWMDEANISIDDINRMINEKLDV